MLLVERNVQFLLQKKLIKANEVIPGRFFDSELPKQCHSKLGIKDNQFFLKRDKFFLCTNVGDFYGSA